MSPEEESCRGGGSPPATGAALHQPHYPLSASPVTGAEPCLRDVKTPISAADTTTNTLDSKNVSPKYEIQSTSLNSIKNIADDVEKFDGKIVYNPNGSAYIFEGESELSEDDSLPDGCIVDGPGMSVSHSLVFPQIANAFYVSRLYAHQAYQQQNQQRGSSMLSINTDLPVMHSYRVFSYRTSEGSTRPLLEIPSSAVPVTSVPVKPILMCFVCKLSFGFTKSFIAHAQSDHELKLMDDERQVLSHSTTSAIIQVVGKSKQPIISFLEPFSTSTYTQNLIDDIPLQKSHDGEEISHLESLSKINKNLHLSNERVDTNISSSLSSVSTSGASTILNLNDASYFIHKNQPINSLVSSSSRIKPETCVTTSTAFNHLKASQGCHSILTQPQNFFSGTTIGVCPEHLQGRPSGIECSKCELILTSGRLSTSGSFTGIHSRNSCKTLKCPKCNWHYKYQETLEIHMKEKHPETETSCIYCIAGQPHPRLARGETYTCGYKPYRCEVCNYSTTTKGNLSIHMQSDKHLNNMQELQQTGNSSSFNNSSSSQDQTITTQSQHHQANQNVLSSQISSLAKQKPLFRCDACNYETNVARNLRIHMTSEKHTHHMLVLQQNLKHIQTLSALQSHQVQQNQIQHQKQHFDQILHFSNLGKPQHAEAALADMAYSQALLFQMITGGHLSSQTTSETFSNTANLTSSLNTEIDSGLSPDSMDPPPEPSDPDPTHLYQCCVCNNFSTDSVDDLRVHLTLDRAKICEEEMLSSVSGHFICKLCSYKTNLKANFQLHCKTDKHLQRLQHVNHVKEGGLQNEWKLKYLTSPTCSAQIRCHACDYYTNSAHKLSLHAMSPKHEAAALLLRHLLEASSKILTSKFYYCALCSFSTKNRLPLLQHVKSIRHLQMEQLHQLQRQTEIQGNEIPHTDLGDVFRVISDPQDSINDSKLPCPSLFLSSTTSEKSMYKHFLNPFTIRHN